MIPCSRHLLSKGQFAWVPVQRQRFGGCWLVCVSVRSFASLELSPEIVCCILGVHLYSVADFDCISVKNLVKFVCF